MPFETNDPAKELRDKARDMFPHNEELARSTYHWNAADEIERLRDECVSLRLTIEGQREQADVAKKVIERLRLTESSLLRQVQAITEQFRQGRNSNG